MLFFIVFNIVFLAANTGKAYAATISVTGKAKVLNTANSYLDFTSYNSNVAIDDGSGNFSGYAFLEDMGWVAFGTTDNSLGPVNLNLTTGAVTGKAKVLSTGAYLDFTNYNSNVTASLATGAFSGYVFSEDAGWINFADTGVSSASPFLPTAPSGLSGTAESTTTITWSWTDNSGNETGFKVEDSSNNSKSGNLAAGTTSWQETSLSPNTSYTRHIHAFNTSGDSSSSGNATTVTLSTALTSSSVSSDKSSSTWYNTSSFVFSNGITGGFGGQAQYFRYAWDTSSTHTWTGSETQWTSGTLTTTATSDSNSWYLHLKGYNSADTENGTLNLGPFYYDATAPNSFDLDSPDGDSYTRSERPTFRWKVASIGDATSGLSKYKLEVDNGDTGDFAIDEIPVSRTTDYETTKYLVHYDGFSDTDSSNNYISIYTKHSIDWGSSENDGKLKAGKRTWKVIAVDSAGNSRDASRTLYVDYTNPSLSSITIADTDNLGEKDGYTVVSNLRPTIKGDISDNYSPDKVEISFFKQNFFLGIETGRTLLLQKALDLKNTTNKTTLSFSISLSQDIDYGKYRVEATGTDKAGNRSVQTTFNLWVLTDDKAKLILTGGKSEKERKKITEEVNNKAQVSLPELEKKAILRREKEAREFSKITETFKDSLAYAAHNFQFTIFNLQSIFNDSISNVKNMAGNVSKSIAGAYNVIAGGREAISNRVDTAISSSGKVLIAWTGSSAKAYRNTANSAPGIVGDAMLAAGNITGKFLAFNYNLGTEFAKEQENVEKQIGKTQEETGENIRTSAQNTQLFFENSGKLAAGAVLVGSREISGVISEVNKELARSQEETKKQIAKTHKNTSDVFSRIVVKAKDGGNVALRSVLHPAEKSKNFAERLISGTIIAMATFQSYMFDNKPTKIEDVALTEIGKDYATVTWKTNHYTRNNKVNYGRTLTYDQSAWGKDGEKNHKVKITNLKPGVKYFFEVMSQNKNYAYDAYYSFETKK